MAILGPTFFQPPITPLFLFFPLHPYLIVLVRITLFLSTLLISVPLILFLTPLSILLSSSSHEIIRRLSPLPIHPHNLPRHDRAISISYLRGIDVYIVGALVWAATICGPAPDVGDEITEWIGRTQGWFADKFARIENWNDITVTEVVIDKLYIPSVGIERCLGVLCEDDLLRSPILGFTLRHVPKGLGEVCSSLGKSDMYVQGGGGLLSQRGRNIKRRAILFFAGGGYVTGSPLVQPFLFNLIRSLPPLGPLGDCKSDRICPDNHSNQNRDYEPDLNCPPNDTNTETILVSPNIRKSLSLDRGFPIPLLDALSTYAHLIDCGYDPSEIILMGDSAGAGLAWSLLAYLAILDDKQGSLGGGLGIPANVIMISPWLSLPPTSAERPQYPDFIYPSLLQQAARCYLSRYPLSGYEYESQNPFISDFEHLLQGVRDKADLLEEEIRHRLGYLTHSHSGLRRRQMKSIGSGDPSHARRDRHSFPDFGITELERVTTTSDTDHNLEYYITSASFKTLSSSHPILSPAKPKASPILARLMNHLNTRTKLHIHIGTAEAFYEPTLAFVQSARDGGVDVVFQEEVGGFHIEGCIFPAELGGAAGRLREVLKAWVEDV